MIKNLTALFILCLATTQASASPKQDQLAWIAQELNAPKVSSTFKDWLLKSATHPTDKEAIKKVLQERGTTLKKMKVDYFGNSINITISKLAPFPLSIQFLGSNDEIALNGIRIKRQGKDSWHKTIEHLPKSKKTAALWNLIFPNAVAEQSPHVTLSELLAALASAGTSNQILPTIAKDSFLTSPLKSPFTCDGGRVYGNFELDVSGPGPSKVVFEVENTSPPVVNVRLPGQSNIKIPMMAGQLKDLVAPWAKRNNSEFSKSLICPAVPPEIQKWCDENFAGQCAADLKNIDNIISSEGADCSQKGTDSCFKEKAQAAYGQWVTFIDGKLEEFANNTPAINSYWPDEVQFKELMQQAEIINKKGNIKKGNDQTVEKLRRTLAAIAGLRECCADSKCRADFATATGVDLQESPETAQ